MGTVVSFGFYIATVSGANENRGCARAPAEFNIARFVTNDKTLLGEKIMLGFCLFHQADCRLSTYATVLGCVGTHKNAIESCSFTCEKIVHAIMDCVKAGFIKPPSPDHGLIGHDYDAETALGEFPNCRCRTWDKLDKLGFCQMIAVFNDYSVAIQDNESLHDS